MTSEATDAIALPSTREHLVVLARRVVRPSDLGAGSPEELARAALDPLSASAPSSPRTAALTALATLARRLRARAIDAIVTPSALRVALDLNAGVALPAAPRRAASLVFEAFAVPLQLERGRLVTLPPPDGGLPADAAAASLARALLARVRSLEVESIADVDPEGVHQLRVAVRRLRVVLRLLERARPGAVEGIEAFVRELGRIGGQVRDHDVAMALLRQVPGAEAALAHLASRRSAALARLGRALLAPTYEAEMTGADAALASIAAAPRCDAPFEHLARTNFDRELRRIARRLGADLSRPGGYHAVRRQARRVRDAAEIFGSVLRKGQRRWRHRLQPLQALLGAFNDVEVTLGLLAGSVAADTPARRWLTQRRFELLAEMAPPLALLAVELRR